MSLVSELTAASLSVDAWRRKQDDLPSRPAAVWQLLAGALKGDTVVVKGKR